MRVTTRPPSVAPTPLPLSLPAAPGSLIGSAAATTNGSGLAAFSGSGLGIAGTVGNFTLSFTSAPLTPVTSGAFALAPGAPAQVAIQTQPAGAASGAAFTTQPVVLVSDAQGNPVGAGITVTASPNGGASLVGSGSASTNGSGVATFSGLGLSGLVGNYSVTFTAGTGNATSGNIALGAGAATKLVMSSQPPGSAQSGAATVSAAVQVQDAAGNPVNDNGRSVTVAVSGATLGGTTSVNTAAGIAAFSGLSITGLVGNYTLNFSAPGVSGISSSTIALTPGAAAALVITAQPPGNVLSGTTFSAAAKLQDASTNGISGVGITAGLNGAGGTLAGGSATTDGTGVATFSGLSITATTAGTFTITFTGASQTSAPSSNINVSLPAAQLGMASQPPATSASGATFGAAVQLLDVNSAPVSQAGVTINVAITGGGATMIGPTSAITNTSGIATFSGIGITGLVNTYSLTFTSGSLTSVQSSGIAITAGAAAKLVMSVQPPSSVANGAAFAAAVQVQDGAGNPVSVDGLPVSVALNGAGGTLTATSPVNTASGVATFNPMSITGLVGNYSLTFSSGSLTSASSSSIALTHGAATQVVFAPAPPGSATSGNSLASHGVQLKDAQGNNVTTAGINVSVGISPAGATVTSGGVAITDGNGHATFGSLTITLDGGTTPPFAGTLTYSAAGVAGTAQSGITIAAFYQLSIVSQPAGAKLNQAFTSQPAIQVTDGSGNPANLALVSVTASIFSGAGSLGGTVLVATNTSGLATFTNLAINHNGSHQLRFGATAIGTVVSNPFVVNP